MSELRGVIVSHAAVAQALVAAGTAIPGIEGVLTPVSNEGCGTQALGQRLRGAVGAGPIPHGRPAADRSDLCVGRTGGGAAARLGGGPARRDPARGRYRHGRGARRPRAAAEAIQRGWRAPPYRPERAAPLRVSDR